MGREFNRLSTVQFQKKMRPAAEAIYCSIWPGCKVEDLRENGVNVHILDKHFGIDSLLHFPSQQWISVQEKYRENQYLKFKDFTQEYKNGVGTPGECDGEWFKLGAQLYFYGWANAAETDFEDWYLLDIPKYKLIVERNGGIDKVGRLQQNLKYGRASFYAIPFRILKDAIFISKSTLPGIISVQYPVQSSFALSS